MSEKPSRNRPLIIATCQFAVSAGIRRNASRIKKQIDIARASGARIVHFCEGALSGYAGCEFTTWKDYPWELLREETLSIARRAARRNVWVILGSAHPLSGSRLPHNSLYLIDPGGRIRDRYDKRFCMQRDLAFYTPGDHFVYFSVNGIRCSLLICFDVRFPELYRALHEKRVQCVFQSFYNARAPRRGIHSHIMVPSMQTRAATNYLWISAANASGYYQLYPSVTIRPDGKIMNRLPSHRAGVMITRIRADDSFYDPSRPFRRRAMRGILHTGKTASDSRSRNRRSL